MNLLSWGATTNRPSGVALIFGSGLVGGAVVRSLQTASPGLSVRQLDWNWADLGAVDAATVEQAALDALESRRDARFSVVWAAGRSGFGSDDADMRREDAALQAVLETARRVGAAVPIERRAFHLVSSAGGLFEGQVAVGRDAAPRPLRPYGEGKLRQEQLVSAEDRLGRRRIYRPSSVFGYAPRARRGLIAALIAAAVQSRTARIMGSMTTQRDYVFARDVGRHISAAILSPGDAPIRTSVLAQGRPTAIFEVIRLIEAQISTPVLLRLDPHPENGRDNTFLQSVLPKGFRPTRLPEGIALTALAMTHDQYTGVLH